jgi:hypothetical protein
MKMGITEIVIGNHRHPIHRGHSRLPSYDFGHPQRGRFPVRRHLHPESVEPRNGLNGIQSHPTGVAACAGKLNLLSWRFENRFFEMPDVVVSPAEAGRLSLS